MAPMLVGSLLVANAGIQRLLHARASERAVDVAAGARIAVRPAEALSAIDEAGAKAALIRLVADHASSAGVKVTATPAAERPIDGFVMIDVAADGPEAALRALADMLEGGGPAVRFVSWSLRPVAGGGIALRARAIAGWRAP